MDKITKVAPGFDAAWDTEEFWTDPEPTVNTDRSAPFDPLGGVMWQEGDDEPDED